MKKVLIVCLTTLFSIAAWANGTTVEDLHYTFDGDNFTATVTYTGTSTTGTNSYSGHIVIPETVEYNGSIYTVTAIGDYAFHGTSSAPGITSISIPETVTSIGKYAFQYCSEMESITLPSQITEIAFSLFRYDSALKKVTYTGAPESETMIQFPPSCTTIGEYALGECGFEGTLVIPATITEIDAYAFDKCNSISEVIFEESNTPITLLATSNYSMFHSCSGLETAYIYRDFELTSGKTNGPFSGGTASTAAKIKKAVFGGKATKVCSYCFSYCATLEEVVFEEDCEIAEFESYAFRYCSALKEIAIPATVTTIGQRCLQNCSGLSSIYALRETHPYVGSGTSVFSGVETSTCILYVPVGSYEDYSDAIQWKEFTNIVEMQGTLQITNANYATFYADYAYIMPEGVTGSTVTGVEDTAMADNGYLLDMNWEYKAGETVPARTALVLKGSEGEHPYAITTTGEYAPADNLLMGSSTEIYTYGPDDDTSYLYYELTNGTYGIGFYYGVADGGQFMSEANKAWLALTADQARGAKFLGFGNGDTTGITSVETTNESTVNGIYTLQGVCVSDMSQKGIYIVNGKKVLVK